MRHAALSINPNLKANHIARSIKRHHVCLGFQWSYEKLDKMPKFEKNPKKEPHNKEHKPIGRYDLISGELLEKFECLRDCIKAGYKNAKAVILGNRKSCKGYTFKYLD